MCTGAIWIWRNGQRNVVRGAAAETSGCCFGDTLRGRRAPLESWRVSAEGALVQNKRSPRCSAPLDRGRGQREKHRPPRRSLRSLPARNEEATSGRARIPPAADHCLRLAHGRPPRTFRWVPLLFSWRGQHVFHGLGEVEDDGSWSSHGSVDQRWRCTRSPQSLPNYHYVVFKH